MRQTLGAVVCLLIMSPTLLAQGEPGIFKNSVGVGAELSIPVGDFADIAGIGYGGFARFQYGVDSRTAFTITAGYTVWSSKDLGPTLMAEAKAFRFLAGGKFYIAPSFFATIEAGTDAYMFDYTGALITTSGTEWRFMLPIGVGFQKSGFEVAGKYYVLHVDSPSFSITAGYNWILG